MNNYNLVTNDNLNYDNIKSLLVNYTIIIFGIIFILIFILLILYYITPNNYELIKWDISKDNFIYLNQIEIILKPDSILNLKEYLDLNKIKFDNYFKISSKMNIIFKNLFKSQNVHIEEESEIFMSKFNSDILIPNDNNEDKKISIYLYMKKKN